MEFKFDKSIIITIIVVVAILLGTNMILNSLNPGQNTVTVNGVSTIKVVPDLVTVNFQIETNGSTSEIARDANLKIFEEFKNSMIKLGYSREDLKTASYNIYQDYDWSSGKRKDLGYKATHIVTVEILANDTEKIGNVIDAGVNAGAGISYINYELTSESQNNYKAQAMELAAKDALVKANSVAQGFDKKVGKLVSTSVSNYGYSPWLAYSGSGLKMDSAEVSVATSNIQPTEQEISASVTAVYKLN
jgi:hypothetical protein